MKKISLALAAAMLALPACGSASDAPVAASGTAAAASGTPAAAAGGTTIVVRGSDFGRMLFNSKRQAIYIFERDRKNRSNCYGECAALWPPVYTKGTPKAGDGVRKSLLGTVKRRNGRLQVTYAGKPLYYYAHEGPGQVRCHNVFLNGGLWWVVGPNGKRRP